MEDLAERMPAGAPEPTIVSWAPSEPMARALASLSPDAFEILNLKDVQQLTYQEIAEIVDIGVSAAKMRVQRARVALQTAYVQALGSSPAMEAHGLGKR